MHSLQLPLASLPRILAYLDPGTGSIIIQVIIAALLGGALLLRTFWKKIFHKKSKPEDIAPEDPTKVTSEDNQPK